MKTKLYYIINPPYRLVMRVTEDGNYTSFIYARYPLRNDKDKWSLHQVGGSEVFDKHYDFMIEL